MAGVRRAEKRIAPLLDSMLEPDEVVQAGLPAGYSPKLRWSLVFGYLALLTAKAYWITVTNKRLVLFLLAHRPRAERSVPLTDVRIAARHRQVPVMSTIVDLEISGRSTTAPVPYRLRILRANDVDALERALTR